MNKFSILTKSLSASLCFIIFELSISYTQAQNIIYQNNFDNDNLGSYPLNFIDSRNTDYIAPYDVCKNGPSNARWTIQNIDGSKRVGITLRGESCVYEIIPTNLTIPNPNHYIYELDVTFMDNINLHRNIAFKYLNGSSWYDLKIFNASSIEIQKVINGNFYFDLGTFSIPVTLTANHTYNFKFEINDINIKIYINNQKVFDKNELSPVLQGSTFALQASTISGDPSNTVYFDNIKVTDLSDPPATPTPTPTPTPTLTPTSTPTPTPTPTTIPFPYFSQRDPQWSNDKYDHINKTIGQVGCALSSAAMVLKSYGLNKVPWGNELREMNPKNLNNWLNTLPEKYFRNGSLNWSTISSLSKALNSSDSAKFTKLEVEVIKNNILPKIDPILVNRHPIIVNQPASQSSSGSHFVAAYAKLNPMIPGTSLYAIADPWNQLRTQTQIPPEEIRAGYHYYPTDSDFSFLWLNADPNINITIADPENFISGFDGDVIVENIARSNFSEETSLNEVDTANSIAENYWQFSQKYPTKGYYHFTFRSEIPGWYRAESYAYNKNGDVSFVNLRFYLGLNPVTYRLDYDPDGETQTLKRIVSFDSLKQLIVESFLKHWITNSNVKEHLYRFVDNAQKVYSKDPISGKNLVRVFTTQILNDYRQTKIVDPGYNLLLDEATELLSIL